MLASDLPHELVPGRRSPSSTVTPRPPVRRLALKMGTEPSIPSGTCWRAAGEQRHGAHDGRERGAAGEQRRSTDEHDAARTACGDAARRSARGPAGARPASSDAAAAQKTSGGAARPASVAARKELVRLLTCPRVRHGRAAAHLARHGRAAAAHLPTCAARTSCCCSPAGVHGTDGRPACADEARRAARARRRVDRWC